MKTKTSADLFEEMITHQRKKLLKLAKEIVPYVVEDDLLQPFDFPELENNPTFRHEEGVLEGLLTAEMAVRAFSSH
jgi:hypothetical protein